MRGISRVSEDLLASQEGMYFMELDYQAINTYKGVEVELYASLISTLNTIDIKILSAVLVSKKSNVWADTTIPTKVILMYLFK
jgi:hypothetical protein